MLNFDEIAGLAARRSATRLDELAASCSSTTRSTSSSPAAPPGTPKAATLSHHNIVNNAYLRRRGDELTEADRLCIPVPMYHCFGMVLGSLTCVAHGAAMVFSSEPVSMPAPARGRRGGRLHRPARRADHVHRRARSPGLQRFDLASLRTGIMAGAPCPVELMKRVMDRDAPAADHHRLRHDRDRAGQLRDLGRRSARTPGRPRSAACCPTPKSRSSTRRADRAASAYRASC